MIIVAFCKIDDIKLNMNKGSVFFNNLSFFVLGMLTLSMLSTLIFINLLHLPLALPELFFFPFYFLFLRKKLHSLKLHIKDVLIALLIIIVLLLLGTFVGSLTLRSMLSCSRSWLYLILAYIVFRRPNSITNSDLFWLSFGSIWGWLLSSIIMFRSLLAGTIVTDDDTISVYGTMLIVPVFLCFTLKENKHRLLLIGMVILILTIILASIRRLIAVFVLSFFLVLFLIIRNEFKRSRLLFFEAIIIFGLFFAALPFIRGYIYQVSPAMYFRTFERVDNMISEGSTGTDSDDIRSWNFKKFAEDITDFTLPRGMIGKPQEGSRVFAPFMDFPLSALCWLFGWPIAVLLLIRYLIVLYGNYRKYVRCNDLTSLISCVSIVVMYSLLFIEGTFIMWDFAIFTGILLGKSVYNTKTKCIVD